MNKANPSDEFLCFLIQIPFLFLFLIQIYLRMDKPLGQDILEMYAPYKNTKTKWKKTEVNNQIFELPDNYEVIKLIGVGAYGAVVAAIDHNIVDKQRQMVAIKKMTNAFEHKIFARRILREIKLLRLLKHQNIVELRTIILPKSRAQFQDIYAIFELMDTDLTSLLRGDQQLSESHYKFFLYQILKALKFLHSANVVHRDLKPRNLLIDANCDLKICDFGLARPMIEQSKQSGMTDYVATRWYRAPQLLLGQTKYSPAVDVWSIGCILAQILTRKPFLPANNTKEQLELICETIQMPKIEQMKHKSEEAKALISKLMKRKKKLCKIDEKIKFASDEAVNLLKRMLAFQPQNRITINQALEHPYMKQLHLQEDEPTREPISPTEFQFQNFGLTTQQLKDLIYEQILLYHFQDFYKSYESKLRAGKSVVSHIVHNSNAHNIDPNADADDDEDDF